MHRLKFIRQGRLLLSMLAGIIMMLANTACNEYTPGNKDEEQPDHTLLMYMVGDNNLSSYLENNVIQAQRAILDSVADGKLNLVIYKDNRKNGDEKPKLYWVHRNNKMLLDTVVLKTWSPDIDSADPDQLLSVIKTTFNDSRFDTTLKGMALASHGAGWVPLIRQTATQSGRRNAFGYDQDTQGSAGSIEIWDLAKALEQGPQLNYIVCDCCNMGCAEFAYEMRNATRYLVASPCEVQGAGMPFANLITRLSQCKTETDLPAALDYGVRCYFEKNAPYGGSKNGATTALYDLSEMSALATAYHQLLKNSTAFLTEKSKSSRADVDAWIADNVQVYGREYSGIHQKYYFLDLQDVANCMSSYDAASALSVSNALDKVVLHEYHSTQFYGLVLDHSCGMAVSLPELFHVADEAPNYFSPFNSDDLETAYSQTAWGTEMGY